MCLDDQILNTYLDGELKEPWKSQVEEHLSYCKSCSNKFEDLKALSNTVKNAALTQEEIKSHQDRVLAMIEKNYMNKHKKPAIFRKEIKFSLTQLMGVAAAFVIVFVGSWAVVGNRSNNVIAMPEVNSTIDISGITPVRASENSSSSKTLENYSLEDILKSLDARGYDVDIRLKSIQPVDFVVENEDAIVLAYSDGTTVSSQGVARDSQGTILATGLTVNELNQVLASDGTVLFTDKVSI